MLDFIAEYWLEFLFGLIGTGLTTACGVLYRKTVKRFKEQDAVRLGVQALLRAQIINVYNEYSERGYCPIYALENMEALYTQYHALGGNGAVTKLKEELEELPTRPA